MSIILFNVMPQMIDILVACTYLASALKGPWVALIVLFTVGSYVPLTLLITEQRGKVRGICELCEGTGVANGQTVRLLLQELHSSSCRYSSSRSIPSRSDGQLV